MTPALPRSSLNDVFARVRAADEVFARCYPGDEGGRQPVHTLYVPAHRFSAATVAEHGREALRLLAVHGPDPASFGAAIGLDRGSPVAAPVLERVRAKLGSEPVEDLRIDFEDGYGVRPDDEEDAAAAAAGRVVGQQLQTGTLPPFVGLRVKPFCEGLAERSVRTLDLFCGALLDASGGRLPDGFVVTFPKIVMPEHVAAFADVLGRLEERLDLDAGALRFEMQIETTQSIVNHLGELALRRMVDAAAGRCSGAHFGTFDYTAACGLVAAEQRITHPACDFSRHVMQVTLAGTGVRLSDGSTNVVPASGDRDAVHGAWRLHAAHVAHSLRHGYYQGWDLHPAHLPSRYAAVYAFHLVDLDANCQRIASWVRRTAAAGGVLDEPATVKALLSQLRRAVDCGAVGADEVLARTGVGAQALGRGGVA